MYGETQWPWRWRTACARASACQRSVAASMVKRREQSGARTGGGEEQSSVGGGHLPGGLRATHTLRRPPNLENSVHDRPAPPAPQLRAPFTRHAHAVCDLLPDC